MKTVYSEIVPLPNYSLSYLINGDSSGLNEDEIIKIDNWLNELSSQYKSNNIIIDPFYNDGEQYFNPSNCIDGYIGNQVIDCKIIILK